MLWFEEFVSLKSWIFYWWLLILVAAYCLHSAHVNVSDFTLVFGSLPRGYSVSQDANMRGQPGTFLFQFCTGYFILVSKGINRQIISNAMDICDRQRKLSRFFWCALAQPPIQVGFTHISPRSHLVSGREMRTGTRLYPDTRDSRSKRFKEEIGFNMGTFCPFPLFHTFFS